MTLESEPTTTTIPSDTDAPAPSASGPAKTGPTSRNATLSRRLGIYLLHKFFHLARKTDHTLVRLSVLFASPTSTDALLCTLSYALELVNALLSRLLQRRLKSFASLIEKKAKHGHLPGESVTATLTAPPSTKILAHTVESTKALASVIGDFRIFVRLWGLAGIYMWARGLWNAPVAADGEQRKKEKALRRVAWVQIASCVLFQFLENGAYLASKGVLLWEDDEGKRREEMWWIWSSRFWAVHVLLEFARLYILYRYQDAGSGEKGAVDDGEKEGKLLKEQQKTERWLWWRDFVSNIAYMPMTLHWSVEAERGILSDWGVGLLGAVAGGALLVDAWRMTA